LGAGAPKIGVPDAGAGSVAAGGGSGVGVGRVGLSSFPQELRLATPVAADKTSASERTRAEGLTP
jgi:hypothetical protein